MDTFPIFEDKSHSIGTIQNKAIRDGKYLTPPHASDWQSSPY